MKGTISPSIGLTLWSLSCIIILIIAFLWLVYFIFKKKSKSTTISIVSVLILTGLTQSCELKHDESISPTSALGSEYDVTVVSKNEMPANALHFSSVEEARSFLKNLNKSGLRPNAELLAAYKKGLSSNSSLKSLDLDSKSTINTQNSHTPPWDIPEYPGDTDPSQVGAGIFSQGYMPWNSVETTLHWSNGHLTNLNTQLQGVTVGVNWVQTGWHDTGMHNNVYTFTVTYHVDVVMFVEGIGTIYTGASHVGYGTYSPSSGEGTLVTPITP